jgi:hypothetical protein
MEVILMRISVADLSSSIDNTGSGVTRLFSRADSGFSNRKQLEVTLGRQLSKLK